MPFLTSSAISGSMSFLTKGIGSKLIAFVVLIFVFTAGFAFLATLLPTVNIDSWLLGMPSAVFFGLAYIDMPFIISTRMSAYATAFLIRRLKVV